MTIRTRLAPTPSGYLHLGNVFSFLLTRNLADALQAEVFLRIDDLDRERMRPAYLEDVFDSLHTLGIAYDFGPLNSDDFEAHWSQHRRLGLYRSRFEQLKSIGALYPCGCSRAEYSATLEGGMPHQCKEQSEATGAELNWRLKSEVVQVHPLDLNGLVVFHSNVHWNDPVIWTKADLPAYQLASLCDDVHYGINLIVRGGDLLESTYIQLELARLLGLHSFLQTRFVHHGLIEAEGQKLSKSQSAPSFRASDGVDFDREELMRHYRRWLSDQKLESKLPKH